MSLYRVGEAIKEAIKLSMISVVCASFLSQGGGRSLVIDRVGEQLGHDM